jgi:hypothetical protein
MGFCGFYLGKAPKQHINTLTLFISGGCISWLIEVF